MNRPKFPNQRKKIKRLFWNNSCPPTAVEYEQGSCPSRYITLVGKRLVLIPPIEAWGRDETRL